MQYQVCNHSSRFVIIFKNSNKLYELKVINTKSSDLWKCIWLACKLNSEEKKYFYNLPNGTKIKESSRIKFHD